MSITVHTTRTTQSLTQTFETVESTATTDTTDTTDTEAIAPPWVALVQVVGFVTLTLGAGAVAYLVPSLADPAQVSFNVANLIAVALAYRHQRA
ncbi:hypothetical protein ACFWJT_23395 [Streptomyces sp. NPDC127069]|uniref:hypothetical protein n=1 Tax=Streptomyces sp. NPDC127069 TaxID=3347128 RepID=UPI003669C3F9